MIISPQMVCCKPMRQSVGLSCDPGWMICCLADQCAKLPTLEMRRRFADQVAGVKCLAGPGMQELFRAEVKRRYEAKRKAG
jgi:hypothetical protein